ncbi:MAG: hypothetical protein ACI9TH_002868 [Kiritimatiellia bacterium]|jgi:hypothetical protein
MEKRTLKPVQRVVGWSGVAILIALLPLIPLAPDAEVEPVLIASCADDIVSALTRDPNVLQSRSRSLRQDQPAQPLGYAMLAHFKWLFLLGFVGVIWSRSQACPSALFYTWESLISSAPAIPSAGRGSLALTCGPHDGWPTGGAYVFLSCPDQQTPAGLVSFHG